MDSILALSFSHSLTGPEITVISKSQQANTVTVLSLLRRFQRWGTHSSRNGPSYAACRPHALQTYYVYRLGHCFHIETGKTYEMSPSESLHHRSLSESWGSTVPAMFMGYFSLSMVPASSYGSKASNSRSLSLQLYCPSQKPSIVFKNTIDSASFERSH